MPGSDGDIVGDDDSDDGGDGDDDDGDDGDGDRVFQSFNIRRR